MSDIDDDSPQNEDNLDEGEEEEEEEEEEVVEATPQATATPNPVPAGSVGMGKAVDRQGNPRRRAKKKKGSAEKRETKPQDPTKPKEGDLLWEWIIEQCEARGVYPGHVNIRVARVDVGREVTVGNLSGDRVMGDDNQTPAEALYEAIEEGFHIPANLRGPILYNIIFSIRGDKGFSHRAQINMPPVDEIMRRRQQDWYPGRAQRGNGPSYVPPPPRERHARDDRRGRDDRDYDPRDRDPRDSRDSRDREGPRGYRRGDRDRDRDYDDRYDDRRDDRRGFGAPYDPRDRRRDPYDDRYERDRDRRRDREMDDLKYLLREALTRGGNQQPQMPQGTDLVALQSAIQTFEKAFGVKLTVAGLGAPPAQPQLPQQAARDPESQEFEAVIARKVRTGVGKRIDSLLEEILDPNAAEKRRRRQQEEDEEEEDEDKPEADIDVVELPVPYPGTDTPLRYAKNKETGEFDWLASLGVNAPVLMDRHGERIISMVETFARGGFAGLGRPQIPAAQQQHPSVNGTGAGRPAPPPAPPPQAPPPPPQDGDDDDDFRF